ncbi:MAG: HD domain-containing phosphohydrolase [Elusimicrobiota bacterium]
MKILLVEDDSSFQQIVLNILEKEAYSIKVCDNGQKAVELIERREWDLIILDIMLPGVNGFELLKKVKKMHMFTPVLMITVLKDRENMTEAFRLGVDDFITKPFDRWEFLARVRSLLNLRNSYKKLEETRNVVVSLSHVVETKDPYTRGHSERVGEYSRKIARELGFSREMCEHMYWAGILHDMGKIDIAKEILTKPGRLTKEEYEKIKVHPKISYKICKNLRTLREALPAVIYHHERWDGEGYPEGLKEKRIPAEARIMAVADAYDAMTSDRSYRKAMTLPQVREIFKEGKKKQWQPSVVEALLSILDR